MEKSIEKIWKEGFMNTQQGAIPKIDNLNGLQSIYFVDQFRKRYLINIVFLVITSIMVLFAFILGGVPIIGLYICLLFLTLAIIAKVELHKLDQLQKGKSSFEYIKAFDTWLKNMLSRFQFLYRIWIPLLFIGFVLALLKTNFFIPFIGTTLIEKIVGNSGQLLIGGIPLIIIISLLLIAAILSYFSNKYFQLEMKSIYGDLIVKLDSLLVELEGLR